MAPQSAAPSVFDHREQIIDNAEFLIGKDEVVQVITCKNPGDKFFKACAVKRKGDIRGVLLMSEPCETVQAAIESLHRKSCEAIHNYISTSGFANPLSFTTAILERSLDDDDTASIISGHSDSSTAAISEWASSGDEATILRRTSSTNGAAKDRHRPAARQANRAEPAADPNERGSPSHEDPAHSHTHAIRSNRPRLPFIPRQAPPSRPPGFLTHPNSNGPPAPPPPPSTRMMPPTLPPGRPHPVDMGFAPHYLHRPNAAPWEPNIVSLSNHGVSRQLSPTGNMNVNGFANRPSQSFLEHTVRLTIKWQGHGEHRVIVQCQPTVQSLQSAAIKDVIMNHDAYASASGVQDTKSIKSKLSHGNLRAYVRLASVDGEQWDMRMFRGNDLNRMFHSMASDKMPSFEVLVVDFQAVDPLYVDSDDDDEASVTGPAVMK